MLQLGRARPDHIKLLTSLSFGITAFFGAQSPILVDLVALDFLFLGEAGPFGLVFEVPSHAVRGHPAEVGALVPGDVVLADHSVLPVTDCPVGRETHCVALFNLIRVVSRHFRLGLVRVVSRHSC